MSRRHLGGIVAAVLAGALLTVSPPGAQAGGTGAGTGGGRQDPQAMARNAARALIAQQAPALKISKHDGFVAKSVISSSGLQYAPYERTWRGLPVVGGDFVVVTDSDGHLLNTSVAQTRKVALATITPRVHKGQATTVARDQLSRVTKSEAPRLVVWQGKTSHLAWETRVSGRDHGEPSIKSVYVDARSGKLLGSREHVAAGTGNGNWEGTVTIPTSGSGTSFSMTNSSASTLKCQNSTGNATFTGTDDVWGNGVATDRETGCVDAFYSAEKMRQMMSTWLGRNGMNGSGGWVPIRVGLNDVNAFYDGTQVQIGHTQTGGKWIGSLDVVAHEFGHGVDDHTPGGISAVAPRSSWATPSVPRPSGSPTTLPTLPTTSSARRSTWSARARSATCTTRLRWATPTATRARSRAPRCMPPLAGQPLVLPPRRGHEPDERPAEQHHLQRHDHDRCRHPDRERSCTSRC